MSEQVEAEPANGHKPLSRQEQEELELTAWCDRMRGVGDGLIGLERAAASEWKEPRQC
jgi:hypothetical protein